MAGSAAQRRGRRVRALADIGILIEHQFNDIDDFVTAPDHIDDDTAKKQPVLLSVTGARARARAYTDTYIHARAFV